MNMNTNTAAAALAILLSSASATAASSRGFDAAMQPVLAEYLAIHKALSSDKEAGVAQAAGRIEKLAARLKPGSAEGRAQLASLRAAAAKLRQARGLAKVREAFKELSRPMVSWARAATSFGVRIVSCSMAKASWLQREAEVANPYYGARMLRCGEIAR
jgi:Cu(I)/Ag(I) efflux system membrane fusion protein